MFRLLALLAAAGDIAVSSPTGEQHVTVLKPPTGNRIVVVVGGVNEAGISYSQLRADISEMALSSKPIEVSFVTIGPNADRTQLQQLVMNLVINGGEAIGDGPGTLTVRVRVDQFTERRERPRTEGFPIVPGEYVRIEVTDTGAGMDAETALPAERGGYGFGDQANAQLDRRAVRHEARDIPGDRAFDLPDRPRRQFQDRMHGRP